MSRHSEDLAAIQQLAFDWQVGWNRGNVEALLALYTADPIVLPQGQPAVIGKDAIRTLYQAVFAAYSIQGNGQVVELAVDGNLGYFWSSYALTATPKASGEPMTATGKSVFIVKRQADHSWKIARLIDNRDEEA